MDNALQTKILNIGEVIMYEDNTLKERINIVVKAIKGHRAFLNYLLIVDK